ncbi:hypothetical protein GE061_003141 [Apolygus lucorum]|uniref:Gustatory receptor n=1 Tax=Apolygus lucorum TaxID=248454 RepID=A0A8S9X2P1_APOLU|nr:hypothetical protein GE061_003141 [Apolygus lucorum]
MLQGSQSVTFCSSFREKSFYDELFRTVMTSDDGLCSNAELVLYLKTKPRTKFSIYGYFCLEFRLCTSIIAAVTMYSVILIQTHVGK